MVYAVHRDCGLLRVGCRTRNRQPVLQAEDYLFRPGLSAAYSTPAQLDLPILHQPRSTQLGRQDYVLVRGRRALHHGWPLLLPA